MSQSLYWSSSETCPRRHLASSDCDEVDEAASCHFEFTAQIDGQAVLSLRGNAEQRSVGINTALLERLASRTGGKQIVDPTQAFERDSGTHGDRPTPVWWWFALAALLLLPFDVAVRRLSFGRRR